jgi:hypothetical protein
MPHFGRSGLGEATKTTWVGIKFGIRTISTLFVALVEYA